MFDHPVILIIVAAAALIRWLLQRSQTAKEDDPERPIVPNQPIPRGGETQTEEERIRRFLEALGQPAGSRPPPKVAPKREIRPRVFSEPTLPPLTTVPPPLPSAPSSTSPLPPPLAPPPIERPVFRPAIVQELGFEVRDVGAQAFGDLSPETQQTAARSDMISMLASTQGLRSAIVLREIFGPPRSLQPLETAL
jgi:hypothetical protein